MAQDVYARLGVKRRLNAAGTLTRLGGAPVSEAVLVAMAEASRAAVDIGELQAAASRTIARITGAEAGIVTSGAAAALTLAAAAAMTRWDVAKMAALPDASDFANEILLPRAHFTGYARALRASGARLVDIGHNDRGTGAGVRGLESWEIDAAITARTAAFAFAANPATVDDLPMVVETCRARGIPVVVDAAAQLPPKSNLRRFFDLGADLVAFSGGKAIGGPQASGILAGRRDLVGAALLQQLDMDVSPQSWAPPDLVDRQALRGVPHHGLGRGFKVGKEEIVGLLTALEAFAAADDAQSNDVLERRLGGIVEKLHGVAGIDLRIVPASETGRVPRLHVTLGSGDAFEMSRRLQALGTPVHVSERLASQRILVVDLQALRPADDAVVAGALRAVLGEA